jgi:N utilization substance protein B
MSRRSRAREVALQVLFQQDLNPDIDQATKDAFIRRRLREDDLQRLARDLVAGVRTKMRDLDGLISEIAEHWTLKRMTPTDRNILRLGSYELLFTETPPKVAIDEAVELAKRYGTAQSSQFVNGILDRVLRFRESAE